MGIVEFVKGRKDFLIVPFSVVGIMLAFAAPLTLLMRKRFRNNPEADRIAV